MDIDATAGLTRRWQRLENKNKRSFYLKADFIRDTFVVFFFSVP
jgi:hypothetical protein